MPYIEGKFQQELFEVAVNEITEYIELNFENMREIADSAIYRIVKTVENHQ